MDPFEPYIRAGLYDRDRVDRLEMPHNAPPPLVGQVWSRRTSERWAREVQVLAVERDLSSDSWSECLLGDSTTVPHQWPPPESVLVAGPGAPWRPRRWELKLPPGGTEASVGDPGWSRTDGGADQ